MINKRLNKKWRELEPTSIKDSSLTETTFIIAVNKRRSTDDIDTIRADLHQLYHEITGAWLALPTNDNLVNVDVLDVLDIPLTDMPAVEMMLKITNKGHTDNYH